MNILVIGGTGTVGSHIVSKLSSEKDAQVTVLTRDKTRPKGLPDGVDFVTGNLLETSTVRRIFNDMDSVFLLNALSPTETHEGLMAVNGAMKAGIQRIVYMSVHNADKAVHLPHFGAKLPIEAAIASSDMEYTILRPNSFFQNDLWLKESLLKHGIYPYPIGTAGLSRVDVRDIADAAVIALTQDNAHNETINLVGPEPLTGPRCAAIWGQALEKNIEYGGNNLDTWEKEAAEQMPSWMVFDMRLMLEHFQKVGITATDEDMQRLTKLLGRPPRSLSNFAHETVAQWRAKAV